MNPQTKSVQLACMQLTLGALHRNHPAVAAVQIYAGCEPDAHSCSTDPSMDEDARKASDEAAANLVNSL